MRLNYSRSTDIMTGKQEEVKEVVLDIDFIRSGKFNKVDLHLLLAIVAHMEDNGKAYPTQKQLAETLGVTDRTVRRRLDDLLECKIDGVPVISKEVSDREGKIMYTLPYVRKSSSSVDVTTVKKPNTSSYTSRTVLDLFGNLYEEKYGEAYVFSYGRDGKLAKDKIVSNFDKDTVERVLTYIFENYEMKWGSKQYPRPTFVSCCGWLFNTALGQLPKEVDTVSKEDVDSKLDKAGEYF